MARSQGKRRKAAISRRRYDNGASDVQTRYVAGTGESSEPLDTSDRHRTVVDGNKRADPRRWGERRDWSRPGD